MTNEQPAADQHPHTDKPHRKKSQKRQRAKQIKVPCLEQEFNDAAAAANAAGLSLAAWSRAMMFAGDPGPRSQRRLPIDAQLARQVLAQLGKYGSNMNQIAYGLNAYGERGLEADFRGALKEWAEIRDTLLAMLGRAPDEGQPHPNKGQLKA